MFDILPELPRFQFIKLVLSRNFNQESRHSYQISFNLMYIQ